MFTPYLTGFFPVCEVMLGGGFLGVHVGLNVAVFLVPAEDGAFLSHAEKGKDRRKKTEKIVVSAM